MEFTKILQEHIKDLTDALVMMTESFLATKIEQEEDLSYVMNIILSAHVSSLHTMMLRASGNDPENIATTQKFINGMLEGISKLPPVENVVKLPSDKTH